MSYSRSKKLTDAEKKLQTLRTQLYGKRENQQSPVKSNPSKTPDSNVFNLKSSSLNQPASLKPSQVDSGYVKKDLLKITILASVAIGAQVLLFVGINYGVVKF